MDARPREPRASDPDAVPSRHSVCLNEKKEMVLSVDNDSARALWSSVGNHSGQELRCDLYPARTLDRSLGAVEVQANLILVTRYSASDWPPSIPIRFRPRPVDKRGRGRRVKKKLDETAAQVSVDRRLSLINITTGQGLRDRLTMEHEHSEKSSGGNERPQATAKAFRHNWHSTSVYRADRAADHFPQLTFISDRRRTLHFTADCPRPSRRRETLQNCEALIERNRAAKINEISNQCANDAPPLNCWPLVGERTQVLR